MHLKVKNLILSETSQTHFNSEHQYQKDNPVCLKKYTVIQKDTKSHNKALIENRSLKN